MRNWTIGLDGCSNSSEAFFDTVEFVAEILRNHRLDTPIETTARLIVARLAHVKGFAPARAVAAVRKRN